MEFIILYMKKVFVISMTNILNGYFPFLDNQSCNELFYNSTLYGLRILVTTFINEILGIKNMLNSLIIKQQSKGFIYNMSLYGTENEKPFVPDNETEPETFNEYFELHPMTLFNSKSNYVVKKIYQTILYSSFTKFFSDFYIQIDNVLNSSVIVFCYLLVIFLILLIVFYFVIWIPYENKINTVIYKTKNMLMIIPIDILRNMPSVYKVLNIYITPQSRTLEKSKNIIE